jgi:hypothetical protein
VEATPLCFVELGIDRTHLKHPAFASHAVSSPGNEPSV